VTVVQDGSQSQVVQQLLDREAIRETLHRYCRGVDRLDAEAIRSAYWPDAHDTHGAYQGGPEGLISRTLEGYGATDHVVHTVASVGIDLRGSRANVESYYLAWFATETDSNGVRTRTFIAGRYLDVFEKRSEEWRILKRTCVYDWIHREPLPDGMGDDVFGVRRPIGGHAPDDELYRLGFA
jgi:hypothetical protein